MGPSFGAFVVAVNLIMGSGILALPRAYHSTGFVLGPIVLGVFALSALRMAIVRHARGHSGSACFLVRRVCLLHRR